eukprot:tig00000402_g235.t1
MWLVEPTPARVPPAHGVRREASAALAWALFSDNEEAQARGCRTPALFAREVLEGSAAAAAGEAVVGALTPEERDGTLAMARLHPSSAVRAALGAAAGAAAHADCAAALGRLAALCEADPAAARAFAAATWPDAFRRARPAGAAGGLPARRDAHRRGRRRHAPRPRRKGGGGGGASAPASAVVRERGWRRRRRRRGGELGARLSERLVRLYGASRGALERAAPDRRQLRSRAAIAGALVNVLAASRTGTRAALESGVPAALIAAAEEAHAVASSLGPGGGGAGGEWGGEGALRHGAAVAELVLSLALLKNLAAGSGEAKAALLALRVAALLERLWPLASCEGEALQVELLGLLAGRARLGVAAHGAAFAALASMALVPEFRAALARTAFLADCAAALDRVARERAPRVAAAAGPGAPLEELLASSVAAEGGEGVPAAAARQAAVLHFPALFSPPAPTLLTSSSRASAPLAAGALWALVYNNRKALPGPTLPPRLRSESPSGALPVSSAQVKVALKGAGAGGGPARPQGGAVAAAGLRGSAALREGEEGAEGAGGAGGALLRGGPQVAARGRRGGGGGGGGGDIAAGHHAGCFSPPLLARLGPSIPSTVGHNPCPSVRSTPL